MTMNRALAVLLVAAVVGSGSLAADNPAKPSPVRAGQYGCVFGFGGTFFDTHPVTMEGGNRYRSANGDGTWSYSATKHEIKFVSGALARDFPTATYVASGPVRGGLKNKNGPAMILLPSEASKKARGSEAVPLYCYLKAQ